MKRHIAKDMKAALLLVVVNLLAEIGPACAVQPTRDWTVMVYMNGKNNLEPDALDNFHSMAQVGSSSRVNFVVEFGRPARLHYTESDGGWSGALRFLVGKGMAPLPAQAIGPARQIDMGRPEALRDFVSWAKAEFPANRYMLVIWNHGQGWRFQVASDPATRKRAGRTRGVTPQELRNAGSPLGGYRAVSSDDDTGSILYNSEIADVIAREFGSDKLHVLGFDACLMAMVETAYAFERNVNVMVASEELEPGAGWRYSEWMSRLLRDPGMTEEDLGRALVESYRTEYGNEYLTTLSAIRLAGFRTSIAAISELADRIRKLGQSEISKLVRARTQLTSYGDSVEPPLRTSVDLVKLLEGYEKMTGDDEAKRASADLREKMTGHIIANYASTRSASPPSDLPYGSRGIAIYLPENRSAYLADPFRHDYDKTNRDRPIDFVREQSWSDLIAVLFQGN